MSGTSSASPENLQVFVKTAGAATDRLDQAISGAAGTVEAFYNAPCDPQFRPAGSSEAFGQAKVLVGDDQTTEQWIAGIRQAFISADTNTLPDSTLAAMLAKEGINPTAPAALTADEPVYSGTVMYSGWTDDPVSTGAGHFLEIERDLQMPAALGVLAWTRTYGSRYLGEGAHGPGWHCWADVRLDVEAVVVTYHGPDGQVAPFARGDDEWVRHPAMEAELIDVDGGFELRWRWTARFPGMTWRFDRRGALQHIRDPHGGDTRVTRRDGRLIALSHEGGRRLDVDWEDGRIAAVRSSDGRRLAFLYKAGHLIEAGRPAGTRRYTIGTDGRIAEVIDADGVGLVRNQYDSDGRVVAQASLHGRVARYRYSAPYTVVVGDDQGGPATLFRHDSAGRVVELQLSDGSRSARRFDGAGNPIEVVGLDGLVTRRQFDDRGYCVRETAPGTAERTWDYDDEGRVVATADSAGGRFLFRYASGPLPVQIEDPLGTVSRFEVRSGQVLASLDPDGVLTEFERDADGQVVSVRDGEGGAVRYDYHRSGQVRRVQLPTGETRQWEYDEADRAVAVTGPDGGRFERRFSPAGRLLSEIGPGGEVTTWEWDDAGSLMAVTAADGTRTAVERDDNGWVTSLVEPTGATETIDRDPLGRPAVVGEADGGRWEFQWRSPDTLTTTVDPVGGARHYELATNPDGRTLAVTTAAGRHYQLRWDLLGRFAGGATPEGPSRADLVYDPAGRPSEWRVDGEAVTRLTYTPGGRLSTLSHPDGSLWRWHYDRAGRAVALDGPSGTQTVAYDPSGRPVRVHAADGTITELAWDPSGQPQTIRAGTTEVTRTYDGWGLVVEERDHAGARRVWDRDALGRVRQVLDPAGGRVSLQRDARGDIVAVTGPEGGRWAYERDPLGRILAIADPLDRRSRYHLDPAGRATRVDLPDGTSRGYRWDGDGSTVGIDVIDRDGTRTPLLEVLSEWEERAVTVEGPDGQRVRVTVDGQNRPIDFDGPSGPGRIDWSEPGSVTVHRADGSVVRADLESSGLPIRFDHPAIGPVVLRRDAAGRLLEVQAEGLRRVWRRDANGDCVEYREELDGSVREAQLERDRSGRVVAALEDGVRTTYQYDAGGQLIGTGGDPGEWRWTYDRSGRLIAETAPTEERTFKYDAADQLIAVATPEGKRTTVDYDGLGRRVAEISDAEGTRYHWDEMDRLVAVERSDAGGTRITRISYDPLGRIASVGDTPLSWDGAGPMALQPARIGSALTVQLPGLPLAEVDGDQVQWLSADWRGSVGARQTWGPVRPGPVRSGPVQSGPVQSDPVRPPAHPELGFLGEIEVEGLVWLRARWYDPATHTFLSRDPRGGALVAAGGGTNPYLYANNDPLQWVDPTGLQQVTAAAASQQMQSWQQGHWKEALVTFVAAVAIAAVVVFAPEGVPLLLPMLIGGAGGAGGTVVGDWIHHQPIQWDQVVMDGAIGAAMGGGGSALGTATGAMSTVAQRTVLAGYGAVSGGGFTSTDRWATGAPFSVEDTAIGAGGGLLGAAAPHVNDDISWEDTTDLTPKQVAVANGETRAANFYTPRVAAARAAAAKLVEAAQATNLRRDLTFGFTGSIAAGAGTPPDPLPPSSTQYPPVAVPAMPAVL